MFCFAHAKKKRIHTYSWQHLQAVIFFYFIQEMCILKVVAVFVWDKHNNYKHELKQ